MGNDVCNEEAYQPTQTSHSNAPGVTSSSPLKIGIMWCQGHKQNFSKGGYDL